MTRREKFSAALYVVTIVASLLFLVFAFVRCSSGNPTQQMVRTAGFVIRANCADMMTVAECLDVLEKNAAIVDQALDGGLR